jgi:outer membrane protein assembly factor BamB
MGARRFLIACVAAAVATTVGPVGTAAGGGDLPAVQAAKAKKKCKSASKSAKRKHCKKKKRAAPLPVSASDTIPPAPPVLMSTDPASPGSGSPKVLGVAEAGSTVRVYQTPDCTGPAATGTAEALASPGIGASATPNATTSFHANATDAAGNISPCSSRLTYTEVPVEITGTPALFPSFDREITDYVTRCDGTNPVSLDVNAPNGAAVSVDGSAPQDGSFSSSAPLQSGQEFSFTIGSYGKSFYVRCLPSNFPNFTVERDGEPSSEFYATDPNTGTTEWSILFDNRGVPIWWFDAEARPFDTKVLSDGTITFSLSGGAGYRIYALDGTLLRTASFVGHATDTHDLQEVGNGDLLVLAYVSRDHADLSGCGLSSDAMTQDAEIQEIDPAGNVVWSWNSADPGHIAPAESARWCPTFTGPVYDMVHINSVEPDGDSVIISLRHTDAIYKIDKATGNIEWKLGGTPTPQSLTVLNDPYGSYPFGGQHDARILPDGTLTLHDNATNLTGDVAHSPRAVRYAIDETARTATLLESVTDPDVPSSRCCGSARRASSGAWTMSWGGNGVVTEFGPGGERVFRITFASGFSYRANPVPDGLLSRPDLRAGMDAMFPRP